MKGITFFSVVPIRREPDETSEMVSQLFFGETFNIEQQTEKWAEIVTHWDQYSGWIDKKMLTEIQDNDFEKLKKVPKTITLPVCTKIIEKKIRLLQLLPAGSVLYNFDSGLKNAFFMSKSFTVEDYDNTLQNASVVEIAKQFLNAPYLWGGKTYFGIDCSGFSQLVYRLRSIPLPRDAKDQALIGSDVNMVHEVNPGDLAFFDNEAGDIIHVGILIDSRTIIHASGKVKIDRFDQQGIYDIEQKKYSHKLRIIKRIID